MASDFWDMLLVYTWPIRQNNFETMKVNSLPSPLPTACWETCSDKILGTPKKNANSKGFLSIESHGLFIQIPAWYWIIVIFSNYFFSPKSRKKIFFAHIFFEFWPFYININQLWHTFKQFGIIKWCLYWKLITSAFWKYL